jgi:dihydroorotase
MSERVVFERVRVLDPAAGVDEVRDVAIADGVLAAEAPSDAERIDAGGLILAPGLVDLHTHLREPGDEHKETVATGTRAAAAGGYTAVAAMANTDPPADNAAIVQAVRDLAAVAGSCDVFPVGAISRGLAGEALAEMGEMVEAGVRIFSDDGRSVPTARLLRNALTYAKAFPVEVVLAEHAEDASLVEGGQMHEGARSASLGLAGRPAEAEEVMVARDLAVARACGGRVHLDDDLVTYDTMKKMNPPLRTAEDRDALRAAVADGTIDAIATDHAPHAVEEKDLEFDLAPPGTIGLETALAVVLTHLVEPGVLPLMRAIEALTSAPARILGAADHGGPLEPGRPANLVVFDPAAEWTVEAPFASKARNTAFLGQRLRGRVRFTMLRGSFTVADGKPTR